jgi:DNA polymerase sigma
VDISISIPELQQIKTGGHGADAYFAALKQIMKNIKSVLKKNQQFSNITVISKARVPLIKGRVLNTGNPLTADGSISFDLCFLNDIAVANSSLIREYSLTDKRVKYLMLAVKAWAKNYEISSAADCTISSYAWTNLVIFFLQCIDFVPNLQSPDLMRKHGFTPSKRNSIDGMQTAFLTWDLINRRKLWKRPTIFNPLPVSFLLYGFFSFYANFFPHQFMTVAIREGKCVLTKLSFQSSRLWRMSIEDPFETHDYRHPHDLGTHLNQKGQTKISNAFQNSYISMKNFLLGEESSVDLF